MLATIPVSFQFIGCALFMVAAFVVAGMILRSSRRH
jgi:hypothetical protein